MMGCGRDGSMGGSLYFMPIAIAKLPSEPGFCHVLLRIHLFATKRERERESESERVGDFGGRGARKLSSDAYESHEARAGEGVVMATQSTTSVRRTPRVNGSTSSSFLCLLGSGKRLCAPPPPPAF